MNITVTFLSVVVLFIAISGGHSMAVRRRRLLEGTPANATEFKFLVQIIYHFSKLSHCVGSLVRPDWVLTAANCVFQVHPEFINVVAGASTLDDPLRIRAQVTQVHTPKGFRNDSFAYDIALLKLETPLFGANIEPVQYFIDPLGRSWHQCNLMAVSYDFDRLIKPPHVLRIHYTLVKRILAYDCKDRLRQHYEKGVTLCTSQRGRKVFDSCDGGAPIIYDGKIVAVVSGPYLIDLNIDVSTILRSLRWWLEMRIN